MDLNHFIKVSFQSQGNRVGCLLVSGGQSLISYLIVLLIAGFISNVNIQTCASVNCVCRSRQKRKHASLCI